MVMRPKSAAGNTAGRRSIASRLTGSDPGWILTRRTRAPRRREDIMANNELDDRGVIVTCVTCGRKNRLTYERIAQSSRCAQCKTELDTPSAPIEVKRVSDFDRLVSAASVPVIVDYWAPWCGPCRIIAPELGKVAARQKGQMLVVEVNTDALPQLGDRFGIR